MERIYAAFEQARGARGDAVDDVRFGENTLGVKLDTARPNLAATITSPPVAPSTPHPERPH